MSYPLSSFADLSDLIPIITFFWLGKKDRLLIIWMSISLVLLLATLILAENGIPNLLFYNIYGILEVAFVGSLIMRDKRVVWLQYLRWFAILVALINLIWSSSSEFNSVSQSIANLTLLVHCYYFFYSLYKSPIVKLSYSFTFWFTAAYFVYLSSTFFTYLLLSSFIFSNQVEVFNNSWVISSIAFILKNIVISFGLYFSRNE